MHPHRNIFRACLLCTAFIGGIWSCKGPDGARPVGTATPYFSLAGYFSQESVRLQQLNPDIIKTVSKNGEQEHKEIQVVDWLEEFALFIDADINKPAWRNSYRVDSTATSLTYTSTDPKLRTAQITVEKHGDGTVKHIRVANQVRNMLYQTDEMLDYYPDSLYRITKRQRVRVIGESQYAVIGKWQ